LTERIYATEDNSNNRKTTFQSTGTPLCAPQIWQTLVVRTLSTAVDGDRPPSTATYCRRPWYIAAM